jgi:hypothetical protein
MILKVGNLAETCRDKLILKYTIYRVVHLLVQIEFEINLEGTYTLEGQVLITIPPQNEVGKYRR